MNKILLIFDIDIIIVKSDKINKSIEPNIKIMIEKLYSKGYTIGIISYSGIDKIINEISGNNFIKHYFCEYGNIYYKNNITNKIKLEKIYTKNFKNHKYYIMIDFLVKKSLFYLSVVDYMLRGNHIDIKYGFVYISLIGMQSNQEEKKEYIKNDKLFFYRKRLMGYLDNELYKTIYYNKILIKEAGKYGIIIYPEENDKYQIIDHIKNSYNEIHYFGECNSIWSNNYKIMNSKNIIGHNLHNLNYIDELKKI